MDIVIYLKICTVGLFVSPAVETCEVYELRPQYAMSQAEMDDKIGYLCEHAAQIAAHYSGHVTRCEVLGSIPDVG